MRQRLTGEHLVEGNIGPKFLAVSDFYCRIPSSIRGPFEQTLADRSLKG